MSSSVEAMNVTSCARLMVCNDVGSRDLLPLIHGEAFANGLACGAMGLLAVGLVHAGVPDREELTAAGGVIDQILGAVLKRAEWYGMEEAHDPKQLERARFLVMAWLDAAPYVAEQRDLGHLEDARHAPVN